MCYNSSLFVFNGSLGPSFAYTKVASGAAVTFDVIHTMETVN